MTPQELLSLSADLGLIVRVEGDRLMVSPAEKLPATLREELQRQKEAILTLLAPASFENPRTKVRQLEKALQLHGPEPEEQWVTIRWREHQHTEQEIERTHQRLLAAAKTQFRTMGDESGFFQVLHIGRQNNCVVCDGLRAAAGTVRENAE